MQQNYNVNSNNSIRNSSTGKSKDASIYEKEINDTICTPNERLMSAQTKNYPLFVTKKIDKYLPFQELK